MKKTTLLAVIAIVCLGVPISVTQAGNPQYTPGDLMLGFQQQRGAKALYVSLGSAALLYRGQSTGPGTINRLNIVNINSELTAAFGSGWPDDPSIYAGLSAVFSTLLGDALHDGDPGRTLYVSRARSETSYSDCPASGPLVVNGDSDITNAASRMAAQNNVLQNAKCASGFGTATIWEGMNIFRLGNQNPFLAAGLQDAAFLVFEGGIQQRGAPGSIGSIGMVSNVEFALDLYRIQPKGNILGQVGAGQPAFEGTYEGTVVIDRQGNVSFLVSWARDPVPHALSRN